MARDGVRLRLTRDLTDFVEVDARAHTKGCSFVADHLKHDAQSKSRSRGTGCAAKKCDEKGRAVIFDPLGQMPRCEGLGSVSVTWIGTMPRMRRFGVVCRGVQPGGKTGREER